MKKNYDDDEKFVNGEGRFDNNEDDGNDVPDETFTQMVRRKWRYLPLKYKLAIIGSGILVVGGIFYGKGKKAGKSAMNRKMMKEIEAFIKDPAKAKLTPGGAVARAISAGKISGENMAKEEIVNLLTASGGQGTKALENVIRDVISDKVSDGDIADQAIEYIADVIDNDFAKEIEKAASKMAVETLREDAAMRDVVYEAASKTARRIIENGDILDNVVKRSASNATEEFLTSKRFKRQVNDLVTEQLGNLTNELTPTIEKVVDKYIEKNYE